MQIVGRRFDDGSVLAASAAFERLRPWHNSYGALATSGASNGGSGKVR